MGIIIKAVIIFVIICLAVCLVVYGARAAGIDMDDVKTFVRGVSDAVRRSHVGENSEYSSGSQEESADKKMKKIRRMIRGCIAGFVVLLFVTDSWYSLNEDHYAVITTFGNPESVSQAGLHFKVPIIQKVQKVSKVIMGMPIGYYEETDETIDDAAIMITKDFNIINTDFYVEYMVSDPVKYLYASEAPESILNMLAQACIRDTVGVYNVDDVITTGKAAIQAEIKEKLTSRMIQEDIGIAVVNITMQDALPPTDDVMNAFKNVETEKQGAETAVNNANKERNEQIPSAEAECDETIKKAEAQKQARINEAEGQVARFEQMYAEYSKYPLITKQRMFYEAMESILPNLKVYITEEDGTQKLLPLEPFYDQMANDAGSAT